MQRLLSAVVFAFMVGARLAPALPGAPLPDRPDSVKFAAIGDSGTGDAAQYEIGRRMAEARGTFPFDMVVMLGDNIYGGPDFGAKFERPYDALLRAGVLFYASLGNHDDPASIRYPGFNMGGERYYTYVRRNVRFFALDSNAMDPKQIAWLEQALKQSSEDWKICYFHHPLYSDGGRHGGDVQLRVALEPILTRYGVNVVLSGHDHVYERLKPQKGITYFVNGSSGELRKGDIHRSGLTAAYFDQDRAFALFEVDGSDLYFEARSRTGDVVDSGTIHQQNGTAGAP